MAKYHDNIIDGDRQTRTVTGTEITRTAIMSEIPDIDGVYKTNWAIENCGWNYGDPHPAYPNAKLSRIDASAVSSDSVKLEYTFTENLSSVEINVSSMTMQVDTNKDKDGNLISVVYKYPDDYELDASLRGKVIAKSPTLSKDIHLGILTIRREESVTWSDILNRQDDYQNKLNQLGWTLHPFAPEGTYKCLDISGDYQSGTGTYIITYTFARHPVIISGFLNYTKDKSFFDDDVYYRDDRTGEPPPDVMAYDGLNDDGEPNTLPGGLINGIRKYETANFNGLIVI